MFDFLIRELQKKGTVRFYVRARPNASCTQAVERLDDESIKVDIAAPSEGGKANAALVKYLANEFSVSKGNVEIVSGQTARHKLIMVRQSSP